jgi:2-polyprenyl-3-methyl-5-hydroxy-6-metoxy-1,4-benzoquinol methylase
MSLHKLYKLSAKLFREKRMSRFIETFGITEKTRILDVGGAPGTWKPLAFRPQVVILNLDPLQKVELLDTAPNDGMLFVQADALRMPFADNSFDVIYCNSMIEHLGNWENQRLAASEIRRVARHYFVQTPNFWFPLEPHYWTPGVQFLPRSWKRWVLPNLTVWGLAERRTPQEVETMIGEISLLTKRQVRRLFPEATIWIERVCGLPKSIIAYH